MNNSIVLGVDVGGTHITAALVDLDRHALIEGSLVRQDVNANAAAGQIIYEWAAAMKQCLDLVPGVPPRVGIAMPGPFDYDQGISLIRGLDKYEALYGLNVKELLGAALGISAGDILMKNDATCFLMGEVFAGAAIGNPNVVGLTLGTGLGSAWSRLGVVYDGDLWCTPFKEARAEDYLSARWLVNRYREMTGCSVGNVKELSERLPADPVAGLVFAEYGNNLGEVLAAFIKRHSAESVVIGGNIINACELFLPSAKEKLMRHSLRLPIIKAKLGEEAALIGGASCWVKVLKHKESSFLPSGN